MSKPRTQFMLPAWLAATAIALYGCTTPDSSLDKEAEKVTRLSFECSPEQYGKSAKISRYREGEAEAALFSFSGGQKGRVDRFTLNTHPVSEIQLANDHWSQLNQALLNFTNRALSKRYPMVIRRLTRTVETAQGEARAVAFRIGDRNYEELLGVVLTIDKGHLNIVQVSHPMQRDAGSAIDDALRLHGACDFSQE